jgi:thymidylate kinase
VPDTRLIALDGAHGQDLLRAATGLHHALTTRDIPCAMSKWDASGLFTDVVAAPEALRDVSARTLMLLYAADLAFRVRWEIAPALEQGVVVVAAPYVTTAITFGLANGLSREWMTTLLRFAPSPAQTVILHDDAPQRAWKRKPERGFCECCTTLLEATPEGFARRKARTAMNVALATAADRYGGPARKRDLQRLAARLSERVAEEQGQRNRRRVKSG